MPRLGVMIVSVREGRVGAPVGAWFLERARAHGGFDVELVDLETIALPLLREPHHPRLQKYTDPATQAWSRTVAALDAFVFVTPEYNFSAPPAFVNALDHLYVEWTYKAAAFVSYGGMSGGIRAVQDAKQMLTSFKVVPLYETVAIPFVGKLLVDGRFTGGETYDTAARVMLDELLRWTTALATLREPR